MPDDFSELENRLTDTAKASLERAGLIAHTTGSVYIGTEHLLLGVLAQNSSIGAKVLADSGVTLDRAEMVLGLTPRSVVIVAVYKGLSQEVMQTIRTAWELAVEFGQEFIGTEHIVYSILVQSGARATKLLDDMNVDTEALKDDFEKVFDRQQSESISQGASKASKELSILDKFGIDLTERSREGKLDPVIGRDKEIERMITILGRRSKNNPSLIGEPGVGKTAVVEGLAQRMTAGKVPEFLRGKKLVQLDLVSMVSGTKYRGQFEERMQKLMLALKKHQEIIVFVDELHLLVGAGGAEGSMDAANVLKPALARGEIKMIGATTFDEYRKHIEKDTALSRRFQTVIVEEPTVDEALAMMRGLVNRLESYHKVKLSDEMLKMSVDLAERYVTDRRLPDKAIDIIDEASALLRSEKNGKPTRAQRYRQQIRRLTERIDTAVESQDYEKAAVLKTQMMKLEEQLALANNHAEEIRSVSERYLRRAVAAMTNVPLANIEHNSLKTLIKLEERLGRGVIGQDEAIRAVARVIKRARSGLAPAGRPLGSFVFLGPTGVGKTELARVLAREVFGGDKALVKIDMSELSEKHTASRLVGAPAGYVGYEDGGKLTDAVRRKPYSVVLFDEIEKAHPDVLNLLLQLLEDGKLTDAKGREVSFRNTIIILTSNIGAEKMMREVELGFSQTAKNNVAKLDSEHDKNVRESQKELEKMMRPELVNRFDAIVTFRALTQPVVSEIFDSLVGEVKMAVANQGMALKVPASVKRHLIDEGFDEHRGIRPLRRVIEQQLAGAVADALIAGSAQPGDSLEAKLQKGEVVVNVKRI